MTPIIRFYKVHGSNQIDEVGYDLVKEILYVKFIGVSLYAYRAVARFLFADSLGKHLNAFIKGKCEYEKLTPEHPAWQFTLGAQTQVAPL